MTDFDARQYLQMKNQIANYEHGAIQLYQLIGNLEALTDLLEERDVAWLKEFRRYWAMLEESYAVALDRGEKLDDPERVKRIAAGLTGLKEQLGKLAIPDDREENL
jgi:hypothetical protein